VWKEKAVTIGEGGGGSTHYGNDLRSKGSPLERRRSARGRGRGGVLILAFDFRERVYIGKKIIHKREKKEEQGKTSASKEGGEVVWKKATICFKKGEGGNNLEQRRGKKGKHWEKNSSTERGKKTLSD